jgi:GT2 family glycosyltransferase
MPHISVILVNYNSQEDTSECVRSLLDIDTTGFELSVLIVDNGSTQPYELPRIPHARKDQFLVIRNDANLGFTGGNNQGIYHAIERFNSEFVLLLNNDTIVDRGFLREMLVFMRGHEEVGICSPKIYFAKGDQYHDKYEKIDDGNIIWYAGGAIDWDHLHAFHRGVDEIDRGQFDDLTTSDFATGCCMLINREVLEKIGLFDKHYFLYLEDVDLCMRAVSQQYEIGFVPSAKIWHKNARSSGGSGSITQDYYVTRNQLYFTFHHGTLLNKLTAIRIAWGALNSGSHEKRLAIFHALTGQFGKQLFR